MAAILGPKTSLVSVKKVSTDAQDKHNDGYKEFQVTAQVIFSVWASTEEGVRQTALEKLDHALS
jgi:hypothetical protein